MTKQKEIVPEAQLVQQRQQGLMLIDPLKAKITNIVIKNQDDYIQASAFLSQIGTARDTWLARVNPIIQPIRASLDLLYDLRKDITDPLDELEGMVKERMRAFKIREKQIEDEAKKIKEAELAKLEKEAKEKEARASAAKTNAMRERLAAQRAELEQRISQAKRAEPTATPIKVSTSGTRTTKKWKVTDLMSFIRHAAAQKTKEEAEEMMSLLTIDEGQMNAYFKLCSPKVGEWMPGIEVFEDIGITRR